MSPSPAPEASPSPREGRRRPQLRVLLPAGLLVVLLAVVAVLLLVPDDPEPPAGETRVSTPVSPTMLLTPEAVGGRVAPASWRVVGTGDNTAGDGINTVCQRARFADPDGEGTLVRSLRSTQDPRRTLLETVEVSRTTESASDAFSTTLGWFAGCEQDRVRLVDAWRVQGLGTRAEVVRLQVPAGVAGAAGPQDVVVGVVRSDRVTISLVARTPSGRVVAVEPFAALLRDAVRGLCEADAAGFCPDLPRVQRRTPPPSGDVRGTLTVADLPALGGVQQPWVGTRAAPARPNNAATGCDRASFVRSGAPGAFSRTFLVPESDLPDRFGLTQTTGTFPGVPRARALLDTVVAAMAGCEEEDLSARIVTARVPPASDGPARASQTAYWRLEQEVSDDRTLASWMGVARAGRHVTQVLFTPAPGADLDERAFAAVVERARDRLAELQGAS